MRVDWPHPARVLVHHPRVGWRAAECGVVIVGPGAMNPTMRSYLKGIFVGNNSLASTKDEIRQLLGGFEYAWASHFGTVSARITEAKSAFGHKIVN